MSECRCPKCGFWWRENVEVKDEEERFCLNCGTVVVVVEDD
jgi:hypothetical protein